MDDESYRTVFKPVIGRIMERFRPGAIVLQCGADSLSGDRLGCFNLSLRGHGDCVSFVKSFGVPTLVLGGGGYTMRNVARCWTYETSLLCGTEIPDELPYNDYFEYYGPDYRLHITPSNMENLNDRKYLEYVTRKLYEVLDSVPSAPGAAIQTGGATTRNGGIVVMPDGLGGPLRSSAADDARDPDTRVKDGGSSSVLKSGAGIPFTLRRVRTVVATSTRARAHSPPLCAQRLGDDSTAPSCTTARWTSTSRRPIHPRPRRLLGRQHLRRLQQVLWRPLQATLLPPLHPQRQRPPQPSQTRNAPVSGTASQSSRRSSGKGNARRIAQFK